ncbi:MAG: DNA damage response protein DdrC [Trueperaceae bacterium]
MRYAASFLQFGPQRIPTSFDQHLQASTVFEVLDLTQPEDWTAYAKENDFEGILRSFGGSLEPAFTAQEFVRLILETDTPEAKRLRRRAQDMLAKALLGDVRLAAEIAERNPNPESRRWLSARLENTEARKELMRVVAKHGGEGLIYGQLGSISNRSILGVDSATIRRERGVQNTRDGLNTEELLRLTYLETSTAKAIGVQHVHGNEAILNLHRTIAEKERETWHVVPEFETGLEAIHADEEVQEFLQAA